MMMNVNFNALENYLEVDKQKLVSKGAESIKSRVMNLQELYKGSLYYFFIVNRY